MLKPFIDDGRRFRRLPGFEQSLVLESIAGLMATRVGLKLLGFQRWKKMITGLTRKKTWRATSVAPEPLAAKIAASEEATARRLPFKTNCLEQSLALLWMLRKRGIAADLRIGARKESNRFEAHAWVEFQGAVLNDAGEAHRHFVSFEGSVTSLEIQTH